jgi:hypothetical protein
MTRCPAPPARSGPPYMHALAHLSTCALQSLEDMAMGGGGGSEGRSSKLLLKYRLPGAVRCTRTSGRRRRLRGRWQTTRSAESCAGSSKDVASAAGPLQGGAQVPRALEQRRAGGLGPGTLGLLWIPSASLQSPRAGAFLSTFHAAGDCTSCLRTACARGDCAGLVRAAIAGAVLRGPAQQAWPDGRRASGHRTQRQRAAGEGRDCIPITPFI